MIKNKKLYKIFIGIIIMALLSFSLTACVWDKENQGEGSLVVKPPDEEIILGNDFTYNYNEATGNNTAKSVELLPKEFSDVNLVVPNRDGYTFDGWYADWLFKTKVSDNKGAIVIDDQLHESKSRQLFAKWKNTNAPIYPILMVFVTEVDAVLKTIEGAYIPVKYSMPEVERKVCEILPEILQDYLNAMLNGLVTFKIDEYFTKDVVGTNSFTASVGTGLNSTEFHYNYILDGFTLPELGGMEWNEGTLPDLTEIEGDGILSKYKSIITSFSMNDYDEVLHFVGGSAEKKYAKIHLETLFNNNRNDDFFENITNSATPSTEYWWLGTLQLYLHEFTHSVEFYLDNMAVNPIDYHDADRYYRWNYPSILGQSGMFEIEFTRLYLLNRVEYGETKLGIPEKFWYS